MNLLGLNISITRNRNSSRSGRDQNQKSLSPAAWLAADDPSPSGPLLHNAYEQVVWVYRAINAIAEQIANIPFVLSRGERGKETLITSGPLVDFYNRPHPQINRFQYWELRVLWLLLRGECFRIPIYSDDLNRNPNRNLNHSLSPSDGERAGVRGSGLSTLNSQNHQLRKVLILDPSRFQHIVDHGQLLGWRYTALGSQAPLESQVFLPEEVWHDKLPNPFDFWRGLSPLQVAAAAAQTDFVAAAFMRGLLENNADNGLIIRTSENLDESQREQLRAALRNRKRRAGVPDRPLVLWNAAEIIQPKLSSADLQFLENRKFSRAEICAAFGVPEEIVATSDHNKYDVMQGARLNFIEHRIAPLCARLEAEENATTIPALLGSPLNSQPSTLNSPVIGWFDTDSIPIMEAARRSKLAAAKTGFDMGVPFNELNRVLDLGFKPLPWGDTGYLPANLTPADPPHPNPDLDRHLNRNLNGDSNC